jgi:thioesterase domain-containing protein
MQSNLTKPTAVLDMERMGDLYSRSNLTRMQLLYWTGRQLRPNVPLYAAPLIFTITSPFDTDLFRTALQTVVDQSDALRTIIRLVDEVPQQIVQPQLTAPLIIRDFSIDAETKTAVHNWFQEIITTPFTMDCSLVQFALARISPTKHIWLMNQHHVIADAVSAFFIYEAVARTYEHLLDPDTGKAPPSITPYQVYREYEREYRDSSHYTRAANFWQKKLNQDVTPLNYFGQRRSKKGTNSTRLNIELDEARTTQLFALAKIEDFRDLTDELTMFNILAALYFALVYHLTGNEHLTFLAPMHNRPTQAFRQTTGLLMELCPFVVDIEPNETPASLVQKLRQQTRGVMRFAQYGSSISLNSKAHDIMFNYHRRPFLTFNGQPVVNQHLHTGHSSDSFALHIHEFESTGMLKLKFDFHQDIFTEEQQQTTVAIFHTLLDYFLTDLHRPLIEVELPYSAVHTPAISSEPIATNTVTYVPPRDRLELDLKNMWEAILGVPRIGIYDNYFDLGGTSWQAMNLFGEIEKLTGQYLPLATLVEAGTIAALADKLRQRSEGDAWPTLVAIQEGASDQLPLYLVHGGGGHVLIFTKLARNLPETQPVYAFQAQGLDGKTQPIGSVEEMAAHYVEALLNHQPEGPYQVGGYSMGGAVAFEMAQQLVARGHTVNFVGIIDTPAQHPSLKWVRLATKFTARLMHLSPEREQQLFIKNRHRFWVGFRQIIKNQKNRLAAKAIRQKPRAAVQNKAQEDVRVQKITNINNRAYFCYVPKRFPGPVTLFKSAEGYRDIYRDTQDPLMGWQRVASAVDIRLLPGNHNQIMDEPHVRELAEAVVAALKN